MIGMDWVDERVKHCCFYGYIITGLAAIVQTCVYPGTSAGMTWVVDGISHDLDLSRGEISKFYMMGTFLGAVLQPGIGWLIDRCVIDCFHFTPHHCPTI